MGEDDKKMDTIPATGHPDEWVNERLRELGLSEDDIGTVTEAAGGLHAEGGRWKICPHCKSNIDMLSWVKGKESDEEWPRLMARAEVECPNCGAFGETFGSNAMNEPHPKLKTFQGRPIHNPFPWADKYLRLAKGIIEKNNLFPADPEFDPDEPHWPRDVGACIVGAALIVASTIKKHGEKPQMMPQMMGRSAGAPRGRKWSNKGGKRPPNGNRRSENERGLDFGD
jgi:hypothetical protein